MNGETLNDCLLNAQNQVQQARHALALVRAIQQTFFLGPRVSKVDPHTRTTTGLLEKLLSDDLHDAQKHVVYIEKELEKRRNYVA